MRHLPTVARVLLGLVFFVFGLNFFLHFLPQPAPPPAAGAFFGALMATGYMMTLLKVTEVVSGALLLSNRFVPLALALLAPVIVNIVFFHAFLEGAATLPLPLAILGLEIFLAWSYRDVYRPMLRAKNAPSVAVNTSTEAAREHAHA
ncbi:MAG: DoxX family membrane protein [Polyangiaceae bacterium]